MKRKLHILIATIACLTMGNQLSAQTEVIYDFNSGPAPAGLNTFRYTDNSVNPSVTTSGGDPAAGPTSTLTPPKFISDNGIPNTTGVLRYQTTSTVRNNSIVSDLNNFPASQNYSVTWKQYINNDTDSYRIATGIVLRANDFPQGGGANPYAWGIKRGYLVVVERMEGAVGVFGQVRCRIFAIAPDGQIGTSIIPTASTITRFIEPNSQPMQKDKAYWFRVSITGTATTNIKFDFSLDGTNYTNHTDFNVPTANKLTNDSGTTQIYSGLNVAFNNNTIFGYSSWYMDDITFNDPPTSATTWLGNAWSNGGPTATTRATIAANYSTARDIVASSLIVKSPAVATIPSGNFINSAGAVTVENGASLTLENNAKLIQTTDIANSGNISVKRNAFNMFRFDYTYWSSPVSGQNILAFSPNTATIPTPRFYELNESSNQFDNSFIINQNPSFVPGKGYAIRAPNDFNSTTPSPFTGTFTGVPNNGNVNIAVTNSGQGFNLVGNPYPSPIDAAAFVTANSLIDRTLYFYSHNAKSDGNSYDSLGGQQYATWNSLGATSAAVGTSLGQNNNTPNGTIQVGQAIIVKANTAGNLTFTNAMRVTGGTANADQFFKVNSSSKAATSATSSDIHRLWLDLKTDKGEGLSQLLVGYVAGATNNVDNLFDGEEFGSPKTSLSSLINGKNYTIQGRELPFNDSDVVPLAFKAAANGIFTIGIAKTDGIFDTNQEILLKDNTTGKLTNLKKESYTFSATAGTANSRFELLFSKATINPADLEQGLGVVAIKKQGINHINTSGAIMKDITVYDIQGKEVLKLKNINSTSSTLSDLQVSNRVFIVKVTTDTNQTQTIKIIN